MKTVSASKSSEMREIGRLYWIDSLQPARAGAGLTEEFQDTFRAITITDIDSVTLVTGMDCGCSKEQAVLLTLPVDGSINGFTLLEAVWAGYMLSLKATMDGGKNDRAHIGTDPDAMDLANAIVERLGATATPCDEVYGTGGTYLESLEFRYDPKTRGLFVDPYIGS